MSQEGGWGLLQHQHRAPESPGELRLAVGQEAVSSIVHTCTRLPGEWLCRVCSPECAPAPSQGRPTPRRACRLQPIHARRTGVASALGCNCRSERQDGFENREGAMSPCRARLRRFLNGAQPEVGSTGACWLLDPSPVGLHVGERQSPAWRAAASFSLQVSDLVEVRPSAGRKQMQLSPITVSSEPQVGP